MKGHEKNRNLLFPIVVVAMGLFLAADLCTVKKADVAARTEATVTYNDEGQMVYHPAGNANADCRKLNSLLGNDKVKTLIIPSGETVEVNGLIRIGDNTTIIATGATIIGTTDGKGIISHKVDGYKYDALKNVTINGGTWKNKENSKACTTMRFAHAYNINIKNATVECTYEGHAVELIACKKVTVNNCNLMAANNKTKSKTSVEEALQIDLATPKTAPGVYDETKDTKYVNGQTCQNIRVLNSTISGSRGVCANFASQEKKFQKKYHKNVTIEGCTITGNSAEGVALFNTIGVTIKNNTIKTNSKQTGTAYANGITMRMWGKNSKAASYKTKIIKNKVYGRNNGISVASMCSSKYGTTKIKKNKVYVKRAIKNAIRVSGCKKVKEVSNKTAKWK